MKIGIDARNLVTSMSGIGRYVLEMSRHLALLGHELNFYLPESPNGELDDLPAAKLDVARFPGGVRRMIWAQTELPRRALKDDVDVFWGPAHRLPFFLDRRIARVITIHDLVWRDMAATMRWQTWMADRWLMKPGVSVADEIVADSAATATALRAEFPGCSEKLNVVYPGLTTIGGTVAPSELSSFGIDRPYILFVGTLEPRKNLLRLLQAYAALLESTRQKFLLVLAGGQGWRLGDLKRHVAELQIESSVRLTGYVSDTDLAQLYSRARLLAMPSLYEGFGFPIIEANAAGIPVLTSNTSSMPEVAGKAGILVDPTDTQSIRDGLERLATDDSLHARLVENARLNSARFDWTESALQLECIFEKAISQRRGGV
ncbi:glycosyltransferase family 1 protein [Rhizobium sp. CNPSo 3968]|uniref:glycosyltransferase family 4 protein n=1 Tax=Rhizobium sp. CNPSo 3968 TaxID=3021408 RepID=UPI00254B1B0E|nr:glycosyltransferase family 1 protein [Rhizobium sp. CNPSo 3968]MDK4724023.1 glycosyltransferase family 1 protein [Rhizobium sp. CNPSo 3968]